MSKIESEVHTLVSHRGNLTQAIFYFWLILGKYSYICFCWYMGQVLQIDLSGSEINDPG